MKHKCLYCGIEFDSPRKDVKYCSNECRVKSMSTSLNPLRKRRIIKCLECGTEVEVMNYTKTKFCSISCSSTYQFKNTDRIPLKVKRICEHCDKEYYVWNYRNASKFCSVECKYLNGRVVSKCKECGHIYTSSKWEDTGYCSSECKNKIYTRKQSVFEKKIFEFISTAISEYTVVSNPIITISDRKIVPDILIGNKLIIECYGDYWHCNPEFYNRDYFHKQIRKFSYEIWESDSYRTKILNDAGYDVIVIWENDFNVKKISLDTIKNNIYEIYKNRKN